MPDRYLARMPTCKSSLEKTSGASGAPMLAAYPRRGYCMYVTGFARKKWGIENFIHL
jgi:hypothetical protein